MIVENGTSSKNRQIAIVSKIVYITDKPAFHPCGSCLWLKSRNGCLLHLKSRKCLICRLCRGLHWVCLKCTKFFPLPRLCLMKISNGFRRCTGSRPPVSWDPNWPRFWVEILLVKWTNKEWIHDQKLDTFQGSLITQGRIEHIEGWQDEATLSVIFFY